MMSVSDVRDLLSDYVILLEKQVEGHDRNTILEVLEFINQSARKNDPDTPKLFLGEDMKTVYFQYPKGEKEKFTTETFEVIFNYMNVMKGKKEHGGS